MRSTNQNLQIIAGLKGGLTDAQFLQYIADSVASFNSTGSATIAHTSDVIVGDGFGNGVDSGIHANSVALKSSTLAQFAPTSSSQLRGVLSDELGTGAAIFDGATPSTGLNLANCTFPANIKIASEGFSIDGGGSVVPTGVVSYTTVPYAGTITAWSIVANGSGPTCTIDVWKIASGTSLPTVSNTIMGTKPALSTGNAIRSTTLTGWNPVAVTANDIIGFNLDAVSVATKLAFKLEITKT